MAHGEPMIPITPGKTKKYAYGPDEYDSKEEIWFSWWADELKEAGYLKYSYQPRKFLLSLSHTYETREQLKTKARCDYRTLLKGHSYTPDFQVEFIRDIGLHQNIYCRDRLVAPFITSLSLAWIDIKPPFQRQHSKAEAFSINQRWMMQRHGIYVNKVVTAPNISKSGRVSPKSALFETTFCPERYRFTDVKMAKRKNAERFDSLRSYIEARS